LRVATLALVVGLALVFLGYLVWNARSFVVTSEFPSVRAAREAGLDRKGWLPIEVPSAGLGLRELHNLDTNQVFGSLVVDGGVVDVPLEPCAGLKVDRAPFPEWPDALVGQVTAARLTDAGFVLTVGSGVLGAQFAIAHNRETGQLVYWSPPGCELGGIH
jgi:hypothetical protein